MIQGRLFLSRGAPSRSPAEGSHARCFEQQARGCLKATLASLLLPMLLVACASSSPPQFLSGADMVYPPDAKAEGIEGYVVVSYDVTAEGMVVNAEVVEAEPEGVFEEAALASIVQWRFRAAMVDGKSVETPGVVSTLRFKLEEEDEYAEY